jgi:cell division protein FtsB
MLQKLKTYLEQIPTEQLRDTRLWTFVVFGILVLLASWSGVRVIETNYELQKKIARLEQQNEIIALQNANQALQNQYLESDTYLELAARKQFGKAAPGESLILVPESVALARTADIPLVAQQSDSEQSAQQNDSFYVKNLKAWRDFVFSQKL